jgi:hypothetical protein
VKKRVSWKVAANQTGLERGSCRISTVKAFTRERLVKARQAGKDLACAVVICELWNLAMVL